MKIDLLVFEQSKSRFNGWYLRSHWFTYL